MSLLDYDFSKQKCYFRKNGKNKFKVGGNVVENGPGRMGLS